MVRFLTELVTTPVRERTWKVREPLVCETPYGRFVVPKGFETDGASVPRVLWRLFPPFDGDYDAAAVLHDYAYRNGGKLLLDRDEADQLLLQGMVATDTAVWKRMLIYYGVRVGGGWAWDYDRQRELAVK